jgi:hypothetical protein
MTLYKFSNNDIFINQLETHPRFDVVMHNEKTYINNRRNIGQSAEEGSISLYEVNADRTGVSLIYPYALKGGELMALETVNQASFSAEIPGSMMTGVYPLTASLETETYLASATRPRISALRNTLEYYRPLSNHYKYDTGFTTDALCLVSIPSMMIGSGIERGTVDIKWYYTGSLTAHCRDERKNGELVSVFGGDSGSVVGVALYNEGFIILTGSSYLSNDVTVTDTYGAGSGQVRPSWAYFGSHKTANPPSSSLFSLSFRGTETIPTMTMLAHAPEDGLNNSSNPTFTEYGSVVEVSGANIQNGFYENSKVGIKNIAQSVYCSQSADFIKQTFISKVGVYDKNKNLIAVAKLANPVSKTPNVGYTFKLKLDI